MARLWSCGFELQSTTNGEEADTFTPLYTSIDNTIKRSGSASLELSPVNNYAYLVHTVAGSSNYSLYFRFCIYVPSLPGEAITIGALIDDSFYYNGVITLGTDGTVRYYLYSETSGSMEEVGSGTTTKVSAEEWFTIEAYLDSSSSAWAAKLRINGSEEIDETFNSGAAYPNCTISVKTENAQFAVSNGSYNTTATVYFDDLAVNDTSGSYHNSWPGEGKIIHLKPNADGDNHGWLKQGGGAGDSNNYQSVDETNPDDATTYLKRTSGQPTDDYNCEDSGIGASDTVNVVAVGVRGKATSNTASSNRNINLRIKKTSGGTVSQTTNIDYSTSSWESHGDATPKLYRLTTYLDPDGAAWTQSTLDSMQIGMQTYTSSTTEIDISTLWALVEYVPSAATNVTVNASALELTASLQAPTITATKVVSISPSVQTATLSIQSPTITTVRNATISPAVQSLTFALNSPTVSIPGLPDVKIELVELWSSAYTPWSVNNFPFDTIDPLPALSFSLNSPTITAVSGATVNADVQTITANLNAPTITAVRNATSSPSVQSLTASIISPIVTAIRNISVSVGALAATFSVVPPNITAIQNIQISPTVQEATFSSLPPTVSAIQNVSVSPSSQEATFSFQSPIVSTETSANVSPSELSATFSALTPTVTAVRTVTANPSASQATFSVQSPTVSSVQAVSVSPSVHEATFSVQSPTVSTIMVANVSVDSQEATFSVVSPTITAVRIVSVSPSVLEATFTANDPIITAEGSTLVQPQVIEATFSAAAPTITTGVSVLSDSVSATFGAVSPQITAIQTVIVSPNVLESTFSVQNPTVTAVRSVSVSPDVLTASFWVGTPSVSQSALVSVEAVSATFTVNQPVVQQRNVNIVIENLWSDDYSPWLETNYPWDVISPVESPVFSVQSPTITTQISTTASVSSVYAEFSVQSPTITTVRVVTVQVQSVSAEFTVVAPRKVGTLWDGIGKPTGIWTDKAKPTASWSEKSKPSAASWSEKTKPEGEWTDKNKPDSDIWTDIDKPYF